MPRKSSKPEGETTLATFRINAGLWRQFQDWARERNESASSVIIQSIQQCLDENIYINARAVEQSNIDACSTLPATVIDREPVDIDVTGVDIDALEQRLAQRVVQTLEGGLLTQLLEDAASFALDDRIRRSDALILEMKQSLDSVDSKVEEASRVATDTATAFIGSQIEKEIKPLRVRVSELESQTVTLTGEVAELRDANAELAERNRELMAKLVEVTVALTEDVHQQLNHRLVDLPIKIQIEAAYQVKRQLASYALVEAEAADNKGITSDGSNFDAAQTEKAVAPFVANSPDEITRAEEETINERIDELQREIVDLSFDGDDGEEDVNADDRETLQTELDELNNQLANSKVLEDEMEAEANEQLSVTANQLEADVEAASDSVQNPSIEEPLPDASEGEIVTTKQLVEILGVNSGYISKWRESGELAKKGWEAANSPKSKKEGRLYRRIVPTDANDAVTATASDMDSLKDKAAAFLGGL